MGLIRLRAVDTDAHVDLACWVGMRFTVDAALYVVETVK